MVTPNVSVPVGNGSTVTSNCAVSSTEVYCSCRMCNDGNNATAILVAPLVPLSRTEKSLYNSFNTKVVLRLSDGTCAHARKLTNRKCS